MGSSFGRMSGMQGRGPAKRERMLFLGGSTLMFIALMIGVILLIQNQSVQAREGLGANTLNDETVLGTIQLVTANTRVPKGSKITPQHLRVVNWPRDQVPEGAIRRSEDVENMFASVLLPEGQPILRSSISMQPPSVGISELLPPGNRAVTINVNAVSGIEGWANAGAHVDVFLTYLDSREGVNKTRMVVENAVVLSFGGSTKAPDSFEDTAPASAMNISTVTLSVPFQDAMKIQTAVSMGRLTLALRNANDIAPPNSEVFTERDWDGPKRTAAPQPRQPLAKGFAKITLPSGEERQFVLGGDDRWQSHGHDDDDL